MIVIVVPAVVVLLFSYFWFVVVPVLRITLPCVTDDLFWRLFVHLSWLGFWLLFSCVCFCAFRFCGCVWGCGRGRCARGAPASSCSTGSYAICLLAGGVFSTLQQPLATHGVASFQVLKGPGREPFTLLQTDIPEADFPFAIRMQGFGLSYFDKMSVSLGMTGVKGNRMMGCSAGASTECGARISFAGVQDRKGVGSMV